MPDMEKLAELSKMASDVSFIDEIADNLMKYAQEEDASDFLKEAGYNPEELTTAEDLIYQAGILLKVAAEMKGEEFLENTKEAAEEASEEKEKEEKEKEEEEKKGKEEEKKGKEEKEEKTAATNTPFLNALLAAKKG